jgi:hypothetical protein
MTMSEKKTLRQREHELLSAIVTHRGRWVTIGILGQPGDTWRLLLLTRPQ